MYNILIWRTRLNQNLDLISLGLPIRNFLIALSLLIFLGPLLSLYSAFHIFLAAVK